MVAVTGASGHIGGVLVRALLAQREHVRVLTHRDTRALEGLDVEPARGDIMDAGFVSRALEGAHTVFHLASEISLLTNTWPLLEAVNVDGTRNVVRGCLERGVRRLVHFSSIHALVQEPLCVPVDESRPLARRSRMPYDRSKAVSESVVREAASRGLDTVVISPTAVVGPFDFKPSHFGEVLIRLARGGMPVLVQGGFDWVDVRDVVEATVRAATQAKPGSRYLLSGHWCSVCEVARMVSEASGAKRERLVLPLWLAEVTAPAATLLAESLHVRPLYTTYSIGVLRSNRRINHERASQELGYKPRPIRETVADTIGWFRERGMLA